MKVKIILAAAALALIAVQIHYTLRQNDAEGETTQAAAATTVETPAPPAPAGADTVPPAAASAPAPVPVPLPGDVTGIRISVGETETVQLTAGGAAGWLISSLDAAPADSDKIARFLDALLLASRQPLPLNAGPSVTGLSEDDDENDDEDVTVRLDLTSGDAYAVRVGLRPDGDFRSTFVAFGQEEPVVLESDLRGPLGLWRNVAGETPSAEAWLLARPFRFEPGDVVKVTAGYPDHEIAFERGPGGGWTTAGYAPGGESSGAAVDAWIADLAAFTVTGAAGAPGVAANTQPAVKLTLGMADGSSRQMLVHRSPDGEGMRAVLDAHPGLEFALPDWRYGKYFLRTTQLFPKSVPGFAVADIRLIDLRHANESTKIARRDDEWRLVGLPYALRPGQIEQLARLAASLAPEDYAAPAGTGPRATGGPVLEIVLADGTMRQYRLGGRHPLFPWRYVTVDGAGVLSLSDAAAAVLFPAFGTVLDLGAVFPGLDAAGLAGVELIRTDDGARLLSLRREDGAWTAENERGSVELTADEAGRIATALPAWRVADFFEADAAAGGATGMMRLRLSGSGGVERGITLLAPQGRDIPYLADGERAFLLRRGDFFAWLGAVRGLGRRIDAAAKAAEDAAAAEGQAAESAAAPAAPPEPTAEEPAGAPPAAAEEEPAALPDAAGGEPEPEEGQDSPAPTEGGEPER